MAGASHLTIGALSRASGVPTGTLRTWERRYGFPAADRDDGGQRLYDPGLVERVRDVAAAIKLGWRPAQAVSADAAEVRRFLGRQDLPEGWLAAALDADDALLEVLAAREWDRLGARAFLDDRLAPFVDALSRTDPLRRRLATDRLRAFLGARWRARSDRVRAPVVVLAGPDDLDLHAAAVVLALAETRVVWLAGAESAEVVAAVGALGARAVVSHGPSNAAVPVWAPTPLDALEQARRALG